MGFHLVEKVYSNVVGTSSTQQSILAYLAHRADDKQIRKCYPSAVTIGKATHFKISTIRKALQKLDKAGLIDWIQGGRHKGSGGKSLANEYSFNLPDSPKPKVPTKVETPPAQTDVQPRYYDIKPSQMPLMPPEDDHEPPSVAFKQECQALAASWNTTTDAAIIKEQQTLREREVVEITKDALAAADTMVTDVENRHRFYSTIAARNLDDVREVICRFQSERKNGEHTHVRNLAAVLNSKIAQLPTCSAC